MVLELVDHVVKHVHFGQIYKAVVILEILILGHVCHQDVLFGLLALDLLFFQAFD